MARLVTIGCFLVGVFACSPGKPRAPEGVATFEELEAYVDSIIATGDPPGISVVAVRDDGTIPIKRGRPVRSGRRPTSGGLRVRCYAAASSTAFGS